MARDLERWKEALAALGAVALIGGLALAVSPPLRGRAGSWLAATGSAGCQERAAVAEAVDGDTLALADGRLVRLLGIDAPEIHNPSLAAPQPLGEEAAARLEELVGGQVVCLESDQSEVDRYGRLLRHVWLGPTLVAEVLVGEGLAQAGSIPPDVRYEGRLQAAEAAAQRLGRGIWGLPRPTPLSIFRDEGRPAARGGSDSRVVAEGEAAGPTEDGNESGPGVSSGLTAAPAEEGAPCGTRVPGAIGAEAAADYVGTFQAVEFRVVRTKDTGRVTFLNSHDPYPGHFYVAIFPGDYDLFPEPPAVYFENRCIVVQGRIELYRGAPQIVLRTPQDVRVVGE